MTEYLTDPVAVGVAASIVFGLLKRTGWLDCTRDEVRFVLAVLLAGVAGAAVVQEPDGVWAYATAFFEAGAAAVFAYQGWKQIVTRWLRRVLGFDVDLIEYEAASRTFAERGR